MPKDATNNFGTVRAVETASAYNVATITLSAPNEAAGEFWALGSGVDEAGYNYVPGASQDATRVGWTLVAHHQGTNWQSVWISILKAIRNVTWGTTIDINTQSTTYRSMSAVKFRPIGGFRNELVRAQRYSQATSATSIALAPPANPMRFPGGLVLAAAYIDSGGAGIDTALLGDGWVAAPVGGLCGLAYYILPLSRVMTPPTVTFRSSRSDTWAGCMAYLR